MGEDRMDSSHGRRQISFLSVITPSDYALLAPHLKDVELIPRQKLGAARNCIPSAYFLTEGLVSIQARTQNGRLATEIAMIGCEGMVGSAAALGFNEAPNSIIVQVGGNGQSIGVLELSSVMKASSTLQKSIMDYNHTVSIQAGQSALSNAAGSTEERLAKWLLMVQDRIVGDELVFSHESIAQLHCTRRPAITIALRRFHGSGLINLSVGKRILITNRSALEGVASGFYGVSELEYDRLF